jgi:hypothetical protein
MKAPRLRWPLAAAASAMALLAACSVVAHAAYPYRPARPVRPGPPASGTARPGPARTGPPASGTARPGPARTGPVHSRPLPLHTASYWGVYEPRTPASYRPIRRFTALMGGIAPRIVLCFSSWGEPFQAAYARAAHNHRALTLVQIQPSDVSLASIAAGRSDGYLRSYAQQVRAFRYPVILSFGHEMNGFWYSWGFGHVSPRTWIAAWRHVVTVFRRQGADNVTWLWTANIMAAPLIPSPRPWWPGSRYVTWVGITGYYLPPSVSFEGVLGPTITDVRAFTRKPILISETGITPGAVSGAMPGLIAGIRQDDLLGLVWFDANSGGDWRLEGHPAAVAAFRSGIARMLAQAGEPPSPG